MGNREGGVGKGNFEWVKGLGEGLSRPFQILIAATEKVPAVRYALGVAGVGAAAAIIVQLFKGNAALALLGTVILIVLAVVLFLFAQAVETASTRSTKILSAIMLYFIAFLFMAGCAMAGSSVTIGWPKFHNPFDNTTAKPEENKPYPALERLQTIEQRIAALTNEDPDATKSGRAALIEQSTSKLPIEIENLKRIPDNDLKEEENLALKHFWLAVGCGFVVQFLESSDPRIGEFCDLGEKGARKFLEILEKFRGQAEASGPLQTFESENYEPKAMYWLSVCQARSGKDLPAGATLRKLKQLYVDFYKGHRPEDNDTLKSALSRTSAGKDLLKEDKKL